MIDKVAGGQRIKEARKHLSLSQSEFAELLEVSQSNISKYERGENELSTESLRLLFGQGINPTWLLTGCGEMLVNSQENLSTENEALKKEIQELDEDIARLQAEGAAMANRLLRIKKLQGQ